MDLLASYNDGSNTPKVDGQGEDLTVQRMEKSSIISVAGNEPSSHSSSDESTDRFPTQKKLGVTALKQRSDKSSSESDSSSDEDSESDERNGKKIKRRNSDSSECSSSSSSESCSEKGHGKKNSKQTEHHSRREQRMSSNSKVGTKRVRSRSGSRGHSKRHSSDRHRRSSSRTREKRYRSSRHEKRTGHHSRSRSRSRSKHQHRRSSRERRHKDNRRRSHGSHSSRRHRRHSSSHRRHRRSHSPDYRKSHDKKRRSRSPHSRKPKEKESGDSPPNSKPGVYHTAGIKMGRGRGRPTSSYKEKLREEYMQNVQAVQDAVSGNGSLSSAGPSFLGSSVATQSAGTGLASSGGMTQVLLNQVQQYQSQLGIMPLIPGTLTPEQKIVNQRSLLLATNRTKEQVEATFGLKVPAMMNENTNNLVEWAKREKKKSLLWKTDPNKKTNNPFGASTILPGRDKEENVKYSRLLGFKKKKAAEEQGESSDDKALEEDQEKLQQNLMMQYDQARLTTHVNRGYGLGYSSTLYQPHH